MPISVHYCQVQYSDFSSQMPLAPKTESAYITSRQKYQGSVGCFINRSLVLLIHLYSCETLEFKILMFTTRLASNLFLFKLRELMLKWTYDSSFWQSKMVNKIPEVVNTIQSVSKPWTKSNSSSTILQGALPSVFFQTPTNTISGIVQPMHKMNKINKIAVNCIQE